MSAVPLSTVINRPVLIVLLLFVALAPATWAKDLYVAQNASGLQNGASCSNALAYTFFNSASNWGTGAAQIGPGTTVHICGTISLAAGATAFTFQGSGAAGNVVTLLFEPGAVLTAPHWAGPTSAGAITASAKSHIAIDGGANGVITATRNGTPGATCSGGPCTYSAESTGVALTSCANCTVQHLTITHMYDHLARSDERGYGRGINHSGSGGDNFLAHGNTISDAVACINTDYSGTVTNRTYTANVCSRSNVGIQVGSMSAGHTLANVTITGNEFFDFDNWNDDAYNFHHDGIHLWSVQSGTAITNVVVANNTFRGDFGKGTAWCYYEAYGGGATGPISIVNNLFLEQGTSGENGLSKAIRLQTGGTDALVATIANNTFLGNGGVMAAIGNQGGAGLRWTLKNNIFAGDWVYILDIPGPMAVASDYNDIYFAGINLINHAGFEFGNLSAWRAHCGCDTHTVDGNPLLSGTFRLLAGSPAIDTGTNLSSLGIAALSSDRAGVARPLAGAWDIGAYQHATLAPSAPTNFRIP